MYIIPHHSYSEYVELCTQGVPQTTETPLDPLLEHNTVHGHLYCLYYHWGSPRISISCYLVYPLVWQYVHVLYVYMKKQWYGIYDRHYTNTMQCRCVIRNTALCRPRESDATLQNVCSSRAAKNSDFPPNN